MVPFVPSCRRVHNAPASPAPIVLVASLRLADGSSRLLLRGPFDGTAAAAKHHADVVFDALTTKHGPGVVVHLLDERRRPFHRVAGRWTTGGAS